MADRTRPVESAGVERGFQVYVGGIDENVQKEQLEAQFARFGTLMNVWIAYNPPGFGFVRFKEEKDAEEACWALNNSPMFGKTVRVEMSNREETGGGQRGRGRGRGRGQPSNYLPTRSPRGYGSVRSRGREVSNRGYGERDYKPAREESNGYRDRDYKPIREEGSRYRDRNDRDREYGSGFRDREYRPVRDESNGYRDREYRPAKEGGDGYRGREYRPVRYEGNGSTDREYKLPRENGDGYRSRDYIPGRSEGNGYRDKEYNQYATGREADRYTPPRDFRTPRDHEDHYKSRSSGHFRDRSRDGDYRDNRSSSGANRTCGGGNNYRSSRSPRTRSRSRSPIESRQRARDRSWDNYWNDPQNTSNSRTKY